MMNSMIELGTILRPLIEATLDESQESVSKKINEILIILEDEDPFIMALDRLQALIGLTETEAQLGVLSGYLAGILHCRHMYDAVM
ncbi:hypothetical protein [Herbaspirillum camelliae]|uniref:hypothetical protein n=1 Tax=Herbaspirillum camelliae TaxID=1892903 RepID=UPI00094A1633|nr:hypothetical protein [Herbaspirillum camelliae]